MHAALVLLLGSAPGGGFADEGPPSSRTELERIRDDDRLGIDRAPTEGDPEPVLEPPPERIGLEPPPPPKTRSGPGAGLAVAVRAFEFTGNRAISSDELREVTAPYTGREIYSEELLEARDAVTRLYIERGYVSSGASIPDQDVADGVVRLEIVEGRLARVDVEGARWLRASYFARRLAGRPDEPVDVFALERRLQLLLREPQLASVRASLAPGRERGESVLSLAVEERAPLLAAADFDTHRSPSVGSEGGGITLGHQSLTGNGDVLRARWSRTEGLRSMDLSYELPLPWWAGSDTRLALRYRQSESEIVERPFAPDDIRSESTGYEVSLSRALYRTPRRELRVALIGEYSRSRTFIFDDVPLDFGEVGDQGRSRVASLRLRQEWTARGPGQILALRSTLSFGIDTLDATRSSSGADGRYVAWLAQAQWVRRLPEGLGESELVLRSELQLAEDELLPIEKFAVGGRHSVRGYRENQLVRDNGFVASAELRIPLLRDGLGREMLSVAPFFDLGKSWDEDRRNSLRTLSSAGIGLRLSPTPMITAEVYWGGRLRHISRTGNDIQNNGFHLQVTVRPR